MTPDLPFHHSKLTVRIDGEHELLVPAEQVTTLIVCERSGQVTHECGLSACEYGCRDVEFTFVRAEVVDG